MISRCASALCSLSQILLNMPYLSNLQTAIGRPYVKRGVDRQQQQSILILLFIQAPKFAASFKHLQSLHGAKPSCCQTSETAPSAKPVNESCCGSHSKAPVPSPVPQQSSHPAPSSSVATRCECSSDCPCCDNNFNCQGPHPLNNALDLSLDRAGGARTPSSTHSITPPPSEASDDQPAPEKRVSYYNY